MVAWLCACEYCTCAHEEIAQRIGVDRATLDELGEFARSERFSPSERGVLAATWRSPANRALAAAVRADLERHFDAGEIVEIVAAIGLYNYLARAGNALEVQPTRRPSRHPRERPLHFDHARALRRSCSKMRRQKMLRMAMSHQARRRRRSAR